MNSQGASALNLTKVLPPRPGLILERERLLNRLVEWEDKKLIIIHGQAGQGKSTLAAAYVRSLGFPAVWYNMDREDDNPQVFLSCFGQAFKTIYPEQIPPLTTLPERLFESACSRQVITQWIARTFGGLPKQSLVVFDDFNSTSSGLLSLLKTLLESTPPHIRFLIISRVSPSLEIAGLRAKRGVGEITGSDLRFNDGEVQQLFGSVFGMPLAESEAVVLNRNAEGWAAGLVLMHEYLYAAVPNSRNAVMADGESKFQGHVFDYLAQEVFGHLPEYLSTFLLRTSVTDYLPCPLIELLTGLPRESSTGPSISSVIHDLQKRNLFAAVADERGSPVIRYHALFRDFLRKMLIAWAKPAEVRKLCSTASAWFSKTGDSVRAIDLLLTGEQFEKALQTIESSAPALIARGLTETMLRWQKQLPLECQERPWFLFSRAVKCRFTEPKTSLDLCDRAIKGFRGNTLVQNHTTGQMLCLCAIIEACFHMGGDFTRIKKAAAMAQGLLVAKGREAPEARARLLLAVGMAWFFLGRLEQSRDALRQALGLFEKSGDHFFRITAAIYLTPCALYQGDFGLAKETVRKGFDSLASAPDEGGSRAALFLIKAMAALFEGRFDEAQDCIDQCKSLVDIHALESIGFLSIEIAGWLKIAQGKYDEAGRMLEECKRTSVARGNFFFSASAAHLLAIAHMFQNRIDKAKIESDYALAVHAESGSRLFHAIYLIASGAIYLKLGKTARAEKDLITSIKLLQQAKAAQQEANAHLMLALLYLRKKKKNLLLRHLRAGFSIGEEHAFVYYALLTLTELAELANLAVAADICPDYCNSLVRNVSRGTLGPGLKVQCLGGFTVIRGNRRVPDSEWKGRLAKTLLKLFVAHHGQKLARERAMELLWPGEDGEDLRMKFNSLLHRVRKVLEPKTGQEKNVFSIYQEGDLITLNGDRVSTDVSEFLSLIARAASFKSAKRPAELLKAYEEAIAVYTGDFLPEDLYNDWSGAMRERLRSEYMRALEDAGELADSLGDSKKSVQFYERIFLSDSCNEKACRWLMSRYVSLGLRAEAVRTYERCALALNKDMDLQPEEKTRKLYRSIIEG